MAFRGRGRGRGGFGRGYGGGFNGPPEPFILFPEDVQLPDITGVTEEIDLIRSNAKLQNYWKSSPYYLEAPAKKSQDTDIERYSDRNKPSKAKRPPLSHHLKLTPANFPLELIEGAKRVQHDQRNVRWNPELGLEKFDLFEKLEQKYQEQEGKGAKEKKEAENEEDNEDGIEEEDEEFSDDGDYNQNEDFDDDDDDFNMDEEGNDDDNAIY